MNNEMAAGDIVTVCRYNSKAICGVFLAALQMAGAHGLAEAIAPIIEEHFRDE